MNTKGIFKKAVNLLTLASFLLWNLAAATPEGGTVAQGSASISQAGTQTNITQTSQNAVINWHGFDTAATESVKFTQPNSSSIALNRINSGTPTNFNGSLSANGQVWILNPSGVLFGASSKVDVAGLLVTTHNITDNNFMSGNYLFTLDPNSMNSKIINNGLISAKDSGIIALVAPHVENNGLIQVNFGKVSLSSGAAYTLDMYGDSLINFGSNAPINNGSVSNAGQIIANGGKVYMTANYASGVLDNTISMSGSIQAKSVGVNHKGEIVLYGGNQQAKTVAGVTRVKGKLDTSSTTSGISGGFIETSGEHVDLADADLNPGVGGTWLLDPLTIDIAAQYGNLIQNELQNGTSVFLSTGVSLATGGTGIIFANQPITWNTAASLTLMAYSSIFVTQPIVATNGSSALILHADTGQVGGTVSFSGAGTVNSNGVTVIYYHPAGGNYAAPTNFSPFFITNQPVPFMTINSFSDLLNVNANPSGFYLLNADIDTAGALNTPVFNGVFAGIFDGHDYLTGGTHTISNVFVTSSAAPVVGAIAAINMGTIENLVVTGNVIDPSVVALGGIAGENFGTIAQTVFNGILFGATFGPFTLVGGIVGDNEGGTITGSGSYGNIAGGSSAGGIAGLSNNGTIANDYSFMSITGNNRGGILGTALGTVTFQYVYYAGNSSGMDAFIGNGGPTTLIMNTNNFPPIYLYSADHCTGCTTAYLSGNGAVVLGLSDSALMMQSTWDSFLSGFTFSAAAGAWTTMGDTQLPTISQNNSAGNLVLLSGTLSTAAVQTVSLYGGNNFIGNISSSATGDYGFEYNPDVAAYGFYLATTNGATVKGAILKTESTSTPVTNLNITNNQVTVDGGGFSSANLAVAVANAPYTVSGNNLTLSSGISFLTTAITPYTLNGNITTSGAGNLTFNAPVTLSVSPVLTTTAGSITFNSTVNDNAFQAHTLTLVSSSFPTFASAPGGSTRLAALNFIEPSITVNSTIAALVNSELNLNTTVGLTSTSGDIIINSLIQKTTVFATNTNLVLNASGDVHINADINLRPSGGPFEGAALVVTAATLFINTTTLSFGGVGIGAGLTLTGFLFHAPVVLQSTVTFNGDAYNEFFSTIQDATPGAHSLTLNLGGGLTYFDADIGGGGNALGSFTQNGSIDFNGIANVTTTGTQTFNNNILFVASTSGTFTGSDVYFNNGINVQSNSAPITVNGNAHITGTINGVFSFFSPTFITINGNTFIPNAGANLTSQGTINFNGNVNSEPGQSGALTTNAPNTEFGGVVLIGTGVDPLNSLIINSPTITLNGGTIIQATQSYGQIFKITSLGGTIDASNSVTFTNIIDGVSLGNAGTLTINGNAVINGTVGGLQPLFRLYVSGTTSLGANINTYGDTEFGGAVTLTTNTAITDTGTGIKFDSTVDSDAFGPWSLTLNATVGPVEFDGNVGATLPLNVLDVTAATAITINPLTQDNFIIHTASDQIYNGPIYLTLTNLLGADPRVTLTSDTGMIETNGTINLTNTVGIVELILDAATDININANVNIKSTGGAETGGSLEMTAGNAINIDAAIVDLGSAAPSFIEMGLVLHSPVNLLQDVIISTDGGASVLSTIDGGFHLTFNVFGGLDIAGDVGVGTALSQLDINGPGMRVLGGSSQFITTGTQYFGPQVFFFGSTGETFTGSTVTFNSGINTNGTFPEAPITVNGNAVFNGDVVQPFPFFTTGAIVVTGSTLLNGVTITSTSQDYQGPVTLNGSQVTLESNGPIHFGSTIEGTGADAQSLVINSGIGALGTVQFDGNVGATVRLNLLDVTGSQIRIGAGEINTASDQIYRNPVLLLGNVNAPGLLSAGNIRFLSSIDGPFDLVVNAAGTAEFNDWIGNSNALNTLNITAANINIINFLTFTTVNDQQYNGPVSINNTLSINVTNASAPITFADTVNGPGSLVINSLFSVATFNDSIGKNTALSDVTVQSLSIQMNPLNLANFEVDTNGFLGQQYGIFMTIGGDVTFNAANGGEIHLGDITGPYNVVATVTGTSPFGDIRLLGTDVQSVVLTSPNGITFQNSSIQTTGNQTYNGNVDSSSGTIAQLASLTGDIVFNGTITGSNFEINQPSFVPGSGTGSVKFKGDVNITATGTSHLWVDGNIINFSNAVSSVTSNGTQIYTGVGANPLLTVNADPSFTAASFSIVIPVLINANTTYSSTAGNIDFQQAITGDGVSSLTLNPVGGTAMFENTVGTLVNPLGSLTINGTSLFDQGSAQNVYTSGSQIYTDTVTLNNDAQLFALDPGPLGTNLISFGAGASGVNGPAFALSVSTANGANGPTGAGITGTVNVGALTLGGAGGANLSSNYPVTESFVAGQGGQQARTNTVSPPDVAGVVIYCVNGFNCVPAPTPTPSNPFNIPPTLVFYAPVVSSCSAGGCTNLDIIMDHLSQTGTVSCVHGFVEARNINGEVRILMLGDPVYAGDTLSSNESSSVCVKSVGTNKNECITPTMSKTMEESAYLPGARIS